MFTRYTSFDGFKADASVFQREVGGYRTVWLRASGDKVLSARFNFTFSTYTFSLNGDHVSEDEARELFNLEMRVYGYASTEKPE